MAAHGARRLLPMAENVTAVIGIELHGGGPGLRFPWRFALQRRAGRRSAPCCAANVPTLEDDRYFHPDLEAASALVRSGAIAGAAKRHPLPGVAEAAMKPDWLQIHRGDAPLIVSFPHTGTDIPTDIDERLVSPWLGRKDADWWVDHHL